MVRKYYGLLEGKKGVIFGALNEQSIAWQIALQVYGEGGRFALSNAPIALRVGNIDELSTICGDAIVVAADVMSDEDMERVFATAREHLGGLDFIVHSVGRSENIRKKVPYEDARYEWFLKTLNIRFSWSRTGLQKSGNSELPVCSRRSAWEIRGINIRDKFRAGKNSEWPLPGLWLPMPRWYWLMSRRPTSTGKQPIGSSD